MGAPEDQVPSIYKDAIRRYEETTKKKLDDTELLKITDVSGLLLHVESENKRFNEFREKRQGLFNVLEAAMIPLEMFGELAGGAASMAFPPSSLVFSAVALLISAAKGVSSSYNAIQELMETIKSFTVRFRIYNRHKISAEMSDQLSQILVTLIDVFALSRKEIRDGRGFKFVKNLFVGRNEEIQASVAKLARLTQNESTLVAAETSTDVKGMGEVVNSTAIVISTANLTLQETRVDVKGIDKKMDLLLSMDVARNEALEQDSQNHLKHVLEPSVLPQDWFDKISKSRVSLTGDWIRSDNTFTSWVNKDIPILWVAGNPGAGKSYLSANIISYLVEHYPQGVQHPSRVSVAYFFFRDDNPKTRSFRQALRDIAYQICQNDPIYASYVSSKCHSTEDTETLESAWRTLFVEFFTKSKFVGSNVYIVLDGVDEAFQDDWKQFFELANDINEAITQNRIQLVMVGRPQLSDFIAEAFSMEHVPTVFVTSEKNSPDIIRYIQSSIQKSSILKRVSAKLRNEIVEHLSEGAQGMFLWVDLMLKEILRKRSEGGIRKAMNEAPKGLTEMLQHVLRSFSLTLEDEEPDFLNQLLAWTTCAESPLTLGQLESVAKLKSADGTGMIYLEGALRKQYSSFFSLNRDDGLSTAEMQAQIDPTNDDADEKEGNGEYDIAFDDVENLGDFESNPETTEVVFCHASIGDYFRNESLGKVSGGDGYPGIGVDINQAKAAVLKVMLEFLSNDKVFDTLEGTNTGIKFYIKKHWMQHFLALDPAKVDILERKDIITLLVKLFANPSDAFAGSLSSDFCTTAWVVTIRKWLDDKETPAFLGSESLEFIKSTHESPLVLKPYVMVVAKKWLSDSAWNVLACSNIVHAYMILEDAAVFKKLSTAEELVTVAKWAALEQTATWHRRLALTLREMGLYDPALEYFNKALELNPWWFCRVGIAKTYLLKLDHKQAIEFDLISEQELRQTLEGADVPADGGLFHTSFQLHAIQERLSICYESLEDSTNSYFWTQKALTSTPGCAACTERLISHFEKEKMFKEIVMILKTMATQRGKDAKHTYLTDYFSAERSNDRHKIISYAAWKTEEADFLIAAIKEAIQAAKKDLKMLIAISLRLWLASFYSDYVGDDKKAIKIWTQIRNTYARSRESPDIWAAKWEAGYQLALDAYKKAFDAGGADFKSPKADKHVRHMEELANTANEHTFDTVTTSDIIILENLTSLILGGWYQLCGRKEDALARFKPMVDIGLKILSDDDLSNDSIGFMFLGLVFLPTHDDKNFIALSHSMDDLEDSDVPENTFGRCDGPCYDYVPCSEPFYTCRYCYDDFCGPCLDMIKGNTMPLNSCSARHEWVLHTPRTRRVEPGKILVDGVLMELKDWATELGREWGV